MKILKQIVLIGLSIAILSPFSAFSQEERIEDHQIAKKIKADDPYANNASFLEADSTQAGNSK